MRVRVNSNDIVYDPTIALRAQQLSRQLNTDPAYLHWYVGQITDPDEDPDAIEALLAHLMVPLEAQAAREVGDAVYRVLATSSRVSLKVAAAAALLRLFPNAENVNALAQILLEGLKADEDEKGEDEEAVINAVSALRDLPADARLHATVLGALIDLVRAPEANLTARCIGLDALVCGYDVPEVRALVTSLTGPDVPAPLRQEVQSVLAFWQVSATG